MSFNKVNAEDVGGEKVINDIFSELAETFGDALKLPINELCYCQKPLKRLRLNRPFSDWRCLSCFANQSGGVIFKCIDDDCVFERHSTETYQVCPSCFEWSGTDDILQEMEEKDDGMEIAFIHRQIHRSTIMISSESPFFC